MGLIKVAEISIEKLEDRKTVTAILHENGYTVGPGKRKKTETGKQLDYYLKVYVEEGTPYCFTWARTDAFTMGEDAGKAGVVIGCEVRFDILEYPSMETSDPDPVMAVDKYIKELYPKCLVMGYDRMEEITEASADQPVVYCRLISSEKQEETNTVAWMDGRIAVHVLCPESTVRLKMAADIANHLSLDGEVIMLDYSPMFIKRLQVNYKSDYLKEGQVFITGHYGLLRYKAKPHVLMAAHGNYS